MKKIVIGCDHAAFEMKELVKEFLHSNNFEVVDCGTFSNDRCDYPDYATKVCREVISLNIQGILLCGSGIGVSMVANRYQGIRGALCRSVLDAEMAIKHNDANVLCLGARQNSFEEIKAIINSFLSNQFEAGRHCDRIKKFNQLGEKI